MIVVMHRSPLRRIDLGMIKQRTPEPPELEHVKVARELGERIAYERIWGLVRQSAEGCNALGGDE